MTNRQKAIDWANERIADPNFSTEPIRVNAWELITIQNYSWKRVWPGLHTDQKGKNVLFTIV